MDMINPNNSTQSPSTEQQDPKLNTTTQNFGQSVEEESKENSNPLEQAYTNKSQNLSIDSKTYRLNRDMKQFLETKQELFTEAQLKELIQNLPDTRLWKKFSSPKQKSNDISEKLQDEIVKRFTSDRLDITSLRTMIEPNEDIKKDDIFLLRNIKISQENIYLIENKMRPLDTNSVIFNKDFSSTIYEKIYNEYEKYDSDYIKSIISHYLDMIRNLDTQTTQAITNSRKNAQDIINIIGPIVNKYVEDKMKIFINSNEPKFINPHSILKHANDHSNDTTFLFDSFNNMDAVKYQKIFIDIIKASINSDYGSRAVEFLIGAENTEKYIDIGFITTIEMTQNKSQAGVKVYVSISLDDDKVRFKTFFKSDSNKAFNYQRAGNAVKQNASEREIKFQNLYNLAILVPPKY